MRRFYDLFPDLARRETRAVRFFDRPPLPNGEFAFVERYCADRGCDCRRVLLEVWWVERARQVATINYAFDPTQPPPFDDEPQVFLDPDNVQSDLSDPLLDVFNEMRARDPDVHGRLVRHYEAWKAVVDDPTHPLHRTVRNASHDDPSFVPAFRPRAAVASAPTTKAGRNDPFPCGSGKKHKKCCLGAGAAS
jgi:hypothetical protein